jgi:hypothetical protein
MYNEAVPDGSSLLDETSGFSEESVVVNELEESDLKF